MSGASRRALRPKSAILAVLLLSVGTPVGFAIAQDQPNAAQPPAGGGASSQPAAEASPAGPPDAKRGELLVSQGNAGGAAPCGQCHGPDGAGTADGPFPRLAGQSGAYLLKQLQNYADGSRPNDIMTPIAQALSPQDRQDAAAYYAAANAPLATPKPGDEAAVARAHALAANGRAGDNNATNAVQACGNCHGPRGVGEPPLSPRLSGQWSGYTLAQLQAFKAGTRKNDVSGVMREIAGKLSDDDMTALASYFESLRDKQASR